MQGEVHVIDVIWVRHDIMVCNLSHRLEMSMKRRLLGGKAISIVTAEPLF